MASTVTDDFLGSAHQVRRRYIRIPKDQKSLLENAWSESLNRGQHPMLNVPHDVLQDVKNLHARLQDTGSQAKPAQQASLTGSRPSTANSAESPPKSSRQKRPSITRRDDEVEESDGTPISGWSPTQHSDQERNVEGELPFEEERVEREFHIPSPRQRLSLQNSPLKRKTPPLFINNHLQSSAANSEGLDIEPLGFVSQEMEPPVNRAASRVIATGSRTLEATPPSAQMPDGTTQDTTSLPPAKRRRIPEVCPSDPEKDFRDARLFIKLDENTLSGELCGSNQNSLNTSASSHSFGNQSACERGQSSVPRAVSDPAQQQQQSNLTPTLEGPQGGPEGQELVRTRSPVPGRPSFPPPPAQQVTAISKQPSKQEAPSLHTSQGSRIAPTMPYEAFKAAYPDYSISRTHFVTALLVVDDLRRNGELHEFLYDDFIRAYSSDFFVYVSECGRKRAQEVMPGVRWYNEKVQNVLYTKRVVRKDNLSDLLAAHSEDAHTVRRAWGNSQSTSSQSDGEDSDPSVEDPVNGDEGLEQEEPEVMELDAEDSGPGASAKYQLRSPTQFSMPTQSRQGSPEFQIESPSAPKNTRNPSGRDDDDVPPGRRSPTPEMSFASQDKYYAFMKPISSSTRNVRHAPSATNKSPAPSIVFATQVNNDEVLQSIPCSIPKVSPLPSKGKLVQREPTISPPPLRARRSSSDVPRNDVADDDLDADEEDAFEPRPMPPPQPKARLSSSKEPILVSSDEEDEGAFESPMPPPRRSARPSSAYAQPARFSDEGEEPKPPPQKPANPPSTHRQPTSITDDDHPNSLVLPATSSQRAARSSAKTVSVDIMEGFTDNHVIHQSDVASSTANRILSEPRPTATSTSNEFATPAKLTMSTTIATAAAQTTIPSTMPAAVPSESGQKTIASSTKAAAGNSRASSLSLGAGAAYRRGSSTSSAQVTRQKQSERSKRLQEFARNRALAGRPFSTSTSEQ